MEAAERKRVYGKDKFLQNDTSRAPGRLGICMLEVQKPCKEAAHTLRAIGMPGTLVVRINIPRMPWNSSCFAVSKQIQLASKGFIFPLLRNLCG